MHFLVKLTKALGMVISFFLSLVAIIFISEFITSHSYIGRFVIERLGSREPHIDGLRGMCAILVALHHFTFFSYMSATGKWMIPNDQHVCETIGKSAVCLFFLICAYLFWGKLARNLSFSNFSWLGFLKNRIRRLVPMYIFSMTCAIILIGIVDQNFILHFSFHQIILQLIRSYSFDFLHSPNFNGSFIAFAAISVSWSLKFEWLFYASLPFIFFSKIRLYWWVAIPTLIVINEFYIHENWIEYFLYGSISYELSLNSLVRKLSLNFLASFLSISLFLLTCIYAHDVSRGWPVLMISLAFLPISAGNAWFGLLTLRGLKFLGLISYSTYLMNVIVESQIVPLFSPKLVYENFLIGVFAMVFTTLIIIFICYLTYIFIESPFLINKKFKARANAIM